MRILKYEILYPNKKKIHFTDKQLLNLTNYDKCYVIGNEINDYEMLKKCAYFSGNSASLSIQSTSFKEHCL